MKTNTIIRFGVCFFLILTAAFVLEGSTVQSAAGYIANPFGPPDWSAESDLPGVGFGYAADSAGDVNGDGYDDVITGAYYYSNGQEWEGRAYVYHGSASGLKSLPAWTFESNLLECEMGWAVSSAGDVNGDGYDDVLVGALYCSPHPETNNREGRVYLFMGSASGLSSAPAWMKEGVGDESFGWNVASAGDVNGDGYDDVIIGAPWASYPEGHEGRAYVYHGSAAGLSNTPNWTKESNIAWSDYGQSVDSAGDVNGDGYDDVVIGHPGMTNPESGEGRLYVYLGSGSGLANMPVWTFENNIANTELGADVSAAGDVNGDGYDDILAGSFKYSHPETREGIAYLFLGSSSGEMSLSWSKESNKEFAQYGQSVASAGDINADGYDDVLVGAPYYTNGEPGEGCVFLYYGSPTGLLSYPVHVAESNQEMANLGVSATRAGDVNGDGIDDMILGAHMYDGGQGNEGRIMVYHGNANPIAVVYLPVLQR